MVYNIFVVTLRRNGILTGVGLMPRDWTGRPDQAILDRIEAAIKEAMDYGSRALAPGWEVCIRISGGGDWDGDSTIELVDPNGNEASLGWDSEWFQFWRMVDYSRGSHADFKDADEDERWVDPSGGELFDREIYDLLGPPYLEREDG